MLKLLSLEMDLSNALLRISILEMDRMQYFSKLNYLKHPREFDLDSSMHNAGGKDEYDMVLISVTL